MTALSDSSALAARDLLRLWRQPWFIAVVLVQPLSSGTRAFRAYQAQV